MNQNPEAFHPAGSAGLQVVVSIQQLLLMELGRFDPLQANPPLPAALACVWGAFLYDGLMEEDYRLPSRYVLLLERWPQGCLELVCAMQPYIELLWQRLGQWGIPATLDWPGVFEYEVVVPLGRMIGDHVVVHVGQLPEQALVSQHLDLLIRSFFGSMLKPVPA